jgi:hypothetical protein
MTADPYAGSCTQRGYGRFIFGPGRLFRAEHAICRGFCRIPPLHLVVKPSGYPPLWIPRSGWNSPRNHAVSRPHPVLFHVLSTDLSTDFPHARRRVGGADRPADPAAGGVVLRGKVPGVTAGSTRKLRRRVQGVLMLAASRPALGAGAPRGGRAAVLPLPPGGPRDSLLVDAALGALLLLGSR